MNGDGIEKQTSEHGFSKPELVWGKPRTVAGSPALGTARADYGNAFRLLVDQMGLRPPPRGADDAHGPGEVVPTLFPGDLLLHAPIEVVKIRLNGKEAPTHEALCALITKQGFIPGGLKELLAYLMERKGKPVQTPILAAGPISSSDPRVALLFKRQAGDWYIALLDPTRSPEGLMTQVSALAGMYVGELKHLAFRRPS